MTLASNFVTAARWTRWPEHCACAPVAPTEVEFGAPAQFGPDRDVPVRLVLPGRVTELHRQLAAELGRLEGFEADQPAYWGEGYRPHLTLGPSISAEEGDRRTVRSVATARLDRGEATVVAATDVA